MNDLNLHISRLLLEHNCVIVPDLGGFVAQYSPAYFDEVAGVFVAPSCQVGFNPLLQADDGLLAQSFMITNHISYDEAIHHIRLCVHELRETLRTRKEATLLYVGTFRLGASGGYEFTPIRGGVDNPQLFGLSALPLQKLMKEEEEPKVMPLRPRKDSYTFHISKSMLRSVAAAAVAIVLYFVWAAPLNRHASMQPTEAQMFEHIAHILGNVTASTQQKTEYQQQFELKQPAEESISAEELMQGGREETKASETPETSENEPRQVASTIQTAEAYYSLVVASQVPMSGAQKLVEHLHKSGYAEARVVQHHNMVRVVVGRYVSYDDARKALKQMRLVSTEFAESWVLKEKNAQ